MFSHIKLRSPQWWVWTLTAAALIAGVGGGWAPAMGLAVTLSVGQVLYRLARHRHPRQFPAQLRLAYLAWMLAGFLPGLGALHWIQMFGTSALVTMGYCPLARLLMLLPWNRSVPLNARRLSTILFHPPIHGSVLTGLPL